MDEVVVVVKWEVVVLVVVVVVVEVEVVMVIEVETVLLRVEVIVDVLLRDVQVFRPTSSQKAKLCWLHP